MDNTNRVLLIEKDELLGDLTALRLELLGFSVNYAPSVDAACAKVKNEPRVALILIDRAMAGEKGDGLSVIQQAIAAAGGAPPPVLLLTTDSRTGLPGSATDAMQSWTCEVLTLPYNPVRLEQQINHLLGRPVPSAIRPRNGECAGITDNETIAT